MRKLIGMLSGIACLVAAGCSSSSAPPTDDAKTHDLLSKPPSLAGMASKHPKGAKEPAGGPAAGGGASTAPTGQ